MLRKILAAAVTVALLLGAGALAETATYTDRDKDFSFDYDTDQFEITLEDYADTSEDADLVLILSAKNPDWGAVDLQFLRLQEDVFSPEARTELEKALGLTLEQGSLNDINDVFMYTYEEDGMAEQAYIIQYKEKETLTIDVMAERLDDEETARLRDEGIDAVLKSVKLLDD